MIFTPFMFWMNSIKMQTRTGLLHVNHAYHHSARDIMCCLITTSLLCLLSCHHDLVSRACCIHHIVFTSLEGIILTIMMRSILHIFLPSEFYTLLLISWAASPKTVHHCPLGPLAHIPVVIAALMNNSHNICTRLVAKIFDDRYRDLLHKIHDAKTFG